MYESCLPEGSGGVSEIHIAGLLIQVREPHSATVFRALAAWPALEVVAQDGGGRLVAVCECDSGEAILQIMASIRDLSGVLNVALVYQHAERAEAMDEEFGHENDAAGVHQA